jgi:hypothetical protein
MAYIRSIKYTRYTELALNMRVYKLTRRKVDSVLALRKGLHDNIPLIVPNLGNAPLFSGQNSDISPGKSAIAARGNIGLGHTRRRDHEAWAAETEHNA